MGLKNQETKVIIHLCIENNSQWINIWSHVIKHKYMPNWVINKISVEDSSVRRISVGIAIISQFLIIHHNEFLKLLVEHSNYLSKYGFDNWLLV